MKIRRVNHIRSDGGRSQSNFPNEKRDCSVVVLSSVTSLSYDACHDLLKWHGRKYRGKSYATFLLYDQVLGKENRINGFLTHTLGIFVKENPDGHFLVIISGHCLGLIDGVYCDAGIAPGKSTEIQFAWKVGI